MLIRAADIIEAAELYNSQPLGWCLREEAKLVPYKTRTRSIKHPILFAANFLKDKNVSTSRWLKEFHEEFKSHQNNQMV